jgi:hypothetical protein
MSGTVQEQIRNTVWTFRKGFGATGIGYANHQAGGSKREVCSMWVVLSLLPDWMHHNQ